MSFKKSHVFFSDLMYYIVSKGSVLIFITLVASLIGSLLWHSRSSLSTFGLKFITGAQWHAPFPEPTFVSLRADDNALIVRFTTIPLSPENISLSQDGVLVPSVLENAGPSVLITSQKPLNGAYTITIPAHILGLPRQEDPFIWRGVLESGEIIESAFLRSGLAWEPETGENTRIYGLLPFIIGTLLSSLMALFLAFPTALASALFLTDFSKKNSKFAAFFSVLVDLLAGIPSIIFGMWGLFFLVPLLGANLLSASLILSIMTVPYASSLICEAISLVPERIRHAGLALGASQSRLIFSIVLPYARSGIIAGALLSLGRALGETLAVTMVIGNRNQIPQSILEPAQTIASLIANEYGEAAGLKQSALIEGGLVLIVITIAFSLLGRWIIRRMNSEGGH